MKFSMMTVPAMVFVLTFLSMIQIATGFSRPTQHHSSICNNAFLSESSSCSTSVARRGTQQTICWAKVGDEEEEEEEQQDLTERDSQFRELMGLQTNGKNNKEGGAESNQKQQKPAARGKSKKAIKKPLWPHDNRDKLPFLVQVMTPPDDILEQKLLQEKRKKKNKLKKKYRRKGMVYHDNDDDDGDVVGETLGEYQFEKNTSSGDKIEIDEQVYLVTKAKCQYRYAGNQQFEMVRKILQVKPVQRAMQEDYIMRQFNAPSARESE